MVDRGTRLQHRASDFKDVARGRPVPPATPDKLYCMLWTTCPEFVNMTLEFSRVGRLHPIFLAISTAFPTFNAA